MAEHSLADISHTDVLLIPGAGNATALREFPEILTWIKKFMKAPYGQPQSVREV